MTFVKMVQEILLGLSIAITIPVIIHWGVNIFYPINILEIKYLPADKEDALPEKEKKERKQNQEIQKAESTQRKKINFWVYLLTAFLTILIGALVKIHSISIGFISAGTYCIIAAIFNSFASSIINFVTFLTLFVALVIIIITRSRLEKN